MQACMTLGENGIDVPGDVRVTGFDHIAEGQTFYPCIGSVDQCFVKMGNACGDTWKKLLKGEECPARTIIKGEFFPGESCGCDHEGNGDIARRKMGRDAFSKRSDSTYFNIKLNKVDSAVLSSFSFADFCSHLHDLYVRDHFIEGDSFHILLEPNFRLSLNDPGISLVRSGYSSHMDVLYSTEDGTEYTESSFASENLVPGYDPEGANHLYVFMALHESADAFGYVVLRDCMDRIRNHDLQSYQSRL